MAQPRLTGLILAALLALGMPAQTEEVRTAAKARYQKGSVLFDLQRYEEAAAEYEAAYELRPDAAFLFNVAQAYRLAKKPERAIRAYTSYLRRTPGASNRAEVEKRIAEMTALDAQQRAEVEEAARARATAAAAPPAPPPVVAPVAQAPSRAAEDLEHTRRSTRTHKWAGLGVGLGGVAIALLGGGLYGVGTAAYKQLNQPGPGAVFDPAVEHRMNTLRPTGVALLSLGLVATAAGATLFGIWLKKERAAPLRAELTPTANTMEHQP